MINDALVESKSRNADRLLCSVVEVKRPAIDEVMSRIAMSLSAL